METLTTLDIFCQNINKYLAVISQINFDFFTVFISLDSKHQTPNISISELMLFFKDSKAPFKIPLVSNEENGKITFKNEGGSLIKNLERIYFICLVDSQMISSKAKEEISFNLEFYDEKGALTCILEHFYELNFERIFEIKFNNYSNPLFAFSNIQLKNLSFYSFSMLAFFLDSIIPFKYSLNHLYFISRSGGP